VAIFTPKPAVSPATAQWSWAMTSRIRATRRSVGRRRAAWSGLGDFTGGDLDSEAYGASNDGSVVVGYGNSDSGYEAFRWTQAGGMVGLGVLAGGSLGSFASGVSGDGSVVVGQSHSASGWEAFRWTQAGGIVGLGDLDGGSFDSAAWGVSGDGSVVVGYGSSDAGQEAIIWDSGHGMRSLQLVLTGDYGLDLTGWTLTRATGISADGTVIVGEGWHNGDSEAWQAIIPPIVIPEPSTCALLAAGLAGLMARRRQRR